MVNEVFKNGVAWLIGAIASGTACVAFTIDAFNHNFIVEIVKKVLGN